jgi:hypothetical protein
MHHVVCHMKDIYWDSLYNNNSEEGKRDTTVPTFLLLTICGNAT